MTVDSTGATGAGPTKGSLDALRAGLTRWAGVADERSRPGVTRGERRASGEGRPGLGDTIGRGFAGMLAGLFGLPWPAEA